VVRRTARGLAGIISGLALVAVAGCGSNDDDTQAGIGPSRDIEFIESAETEEPAEQSDVPLEVDESKAEEISGLSTITIPKLDIQAPIVKIESSDDRVLTPPRDPGVVGWWSQGAAPGASTGSAILVGHAVRTGGGVFNDIGELTSGDTVEVGSLTYQVNSTETLSKDEVAERAEELFDQSVPGRLVIVTCADWDGEVWQSNIITIAEPV
jgi:LPXTG-site transpeptidase (sortase) family protein